MIDFSLTDEQKALQEMTREFVAGEITPKAAKYDTLMEYPWDIAERAHQNGLLNLSIPESYGGPGLSLVDKMVIQEEIAYGCTGIGTALTANELALGPLVEFGTKEQIEELAVPMLSKLQMSAYCVTEPGAGSDVAAIKTKATRSGDHYSLDGEKMWITNGSVASWYYVLATMEPGAGHKAMCAFAIPSDLEGIEVGKKELNMGQRCSDTRAIKFNQVKVPKRYLLGKEGDGFKIAMRAFDLSRPSVAIGAVGLARRAMDCAKQYALERKAFGKPIASHQAISFMIADMAKDIEAARLLTYKSAWLLDQGESNTKLASMAKCLAGDICVRIASDAIQVFGGYGFNCEYPVEKLYRDSKIYQIYEGTQQIQRLIIGRSELSQ